MITKEDLLTLKSEIETAKQNIAELQGQRKALLKQLKEEWSCDSVEAASKKLKRMKTNIEQMQTELNEKVKTAQDLREAVLRKMLENTPPSKTALAFIKDEVKSLI